MSATFVSLPGASGRTLRRRLLALLLARPAAAAGGAVLVVAAAGLLATHHSTPLRFPRAAAIERVRRDPATGPIVSKLHWTGAEITALDPRHEAVWLMNGPRLVLTAELSPSGHVGSYRVDARRSYAYGSNIANDVRVLALLCVLFIGMTAVLPLWRVRNLDVAVAVSSVAAVVLLNRGMIDRVVVVGYSLLGYFAFRCLWSSLGPQRSRRPSVPLYDGLTRGWSVRRRRRLLKQILLACALIVVMVGLSSQGVIDVGYAVMEGATAITHGILPYGHIPDIFHGDTYPIGSYLLYTPFALLSPVYSVFDSADSTLLVAVVAGLFVAWGISRARRLKPSQAEPSRSNTGDTEGLRAAIAWLTFPPLLVTISTGTTDVALAAILLGAILLWRRPALSATVLAAGAWFKLTPLALIPLWLAPLRGRGLLRAVAAIAGVSLLVVGTLVLLGGWNAPSAMVDAIAYQGARSSANSLWTVVGSVPLQQLAQAGALSLVAGAVVRLRRDHRLALDASRVAALAAAVLLAVQISAGYWSFMYLAWVYPFLALSVLGGSEAPQAVQRLSTVSVVAST